MPPIDDAVASALIGTIEQRYLMLVRKASVLTDKGARIKHRLFHARALECATLLTEYYRRSGDEQEATRWELRRKQNEARAFNHQNTIVERISRPVLGNGDEDDDT